MAEPLHATSVFRHPLQNWWELSKYNEDHGQILTYDELIDAIKYQIEKKLNKTKDNLIFGEKYHLNDLQLVFERHQWQSLLENISKLPKHYYPILTFHATSHPKHLQSIAKHGYLMPGDIHPEDGHSLKMANGQYYGDGIYSSTEFKTSEWYTFLDRDQSVQIMINLVLVGQMHVVEEDDMIDDKYSYNYGSYLASIANGQYLDGSHTRTPAVNGQNTFRTWISASSANIIPLMILTAKPNWDHSKMVKYLYVPKPESKKKAKKARHKAKLAQRGLLINLTPQPFVKYPKDVADSERVIFRQIFGDYYLILPPTHIDLPPPPDIKSYLILPSSMPYLNTLTNYIRMLTESDVTFYDLPTGEFQHYGNVSADQFLSHAKTNQPNRSLLIGKNPEKTWAANLFKPINHVFSRVENGNSESIHVIYLFVNHSWTITDQINQLMNNHHAYLQVKQVIIKIIFLKSDLTPEMVSGCHFLKIHLQNVTHFETFSHTVDINNPLETCLENIQVELSHLKSGLTYSVPYPMGRIHEGFLSNLHEPPTWDLESFMPAIYRGGYVETLNVEYNRYRTRFLSLEDLKSYEIDEAHLETSRSALLGLLCIFRNYVMAHPERILRLMPSIEHICQGYMTLVSTETSPSTIRLATYQLNQIVGDLRTYAKATFKGAWFEQMTRLKFGRQILKRSLGRLELTPTDLKEMQLILRQRKPLKEACDALAYDQTQGWGLHVTRTHASEIEPWLVKINYVSPQTLFSVRQIYRSHELGEQLTDMSEYDRKAEISDILPIKPCTHPKISEMQRAYTFTRNPYLSISGQEQALLTIAWIRQVEMLMTETGHPLFSQRLEQCFDLYGRVKSAFVHDQRLKHLLELILTADGCNLEEYLTETHQVASIAQILGVLTQDNAKPLFENDNRAHRLAFALLAEAVMRSTRVLIRGSALGNCASQTLIRRALGLKSETDLSTYQCRLKRAVRHSGACYQDMHTNTTPFAVVSVYEFLNYFHHVDSNAKGDVQAQLLEKYQNREISMKNFLATHLPGCDKYETQVALYLQGLRYHSASSRHQLKFDNPKQMIADILAEQLRLIKHEQAIRDEARNRIQRRLLARVQLAQPYLEYHQGIPKMFTQQEVDELNRGRSIEDQLILKSTGLLKHHCCFPNCPQYLQNLATLQDIRNNQAHGLDRHMNSCRYLGTYVKGLHHFAQKYASRPFEAFVTQMGHQLNNQRAYDMLTPNELKFLWESYH